MTATIALAIPHTPWRVDRIESLDRLTNGLGLVGDKWISSNDGPQHFRLFNERESNRVWPGKLWRWALSVDATHLLQIQDDVIVAPNFWRALRGMLGAQPNRLIGLHSNHPLVPVQLKAGRRWYRDHWLTGPAYVFPRELLGAFVTWCDVNPKRVESTNEDSLISFWAHENGVDVWHPVCAIQDHDLGVESTYGNDGHHEFSMYRRPLVTWRDMPSLEALESVDFWRCTEESAPLLPGPGTQLCWYCALADGKLTSAKTGARLCKQCLADMLGHILNRY